MRLRADDGSEPESPRLGDSTIPVRDSSQLACQPELAEACERL
jgi:hypothetical protein